uniref:Uncharacterized protein n=1 Tax=Cucumis melo TaxID=3656 RepID=A0A9I9EGA4_CUCME
MSSRFRAENLDGRRRQKGLGFRVKRDRVRAILEVVLFRGLSEFIHRESDLHVFRFTREISKFRGTLHVC